MVSVVCASPPPPASQADPVVVRIPPAPACTQFPEVKAESVTFDTVIAGEPVSPPSVPVVFWLNVGKAVMFAALIVGAVWKVGTPAPPVAGSPDLNRKHTSELQSHLNLVCRLLLEKKKKDN